MNRVALLAFVMLAGCDLSLQALTTPPPGAKAQLDGDEQVITLSRGAALAVACTDGGDLCDNLTVAVGNDDIAGARVAFRDALDFTWEGPRQATSFVIFARAAGRTTVHVDSSNGTVDYDVIVEE